MKIILLDSTIEPIFWRFVEERIEEYFFFIMDYKQNPNVTRIWIAFDDVGGIQGMLLNYKNKNVHIRGSNEAVKELADYVDIRTPEITVINTQKELLSPADKEHKKEVLINRMVIHLGENLMINEHVSEILHESDREEIAALYRKADPIFWSHVQGKDVELDENHIWFGIKREDRIVSFANIWIGEEIGIIPTVATDPDFQNQGLATSLVSRSVQELFKHTTLGLIHVRAENSPAVHIYEKIGYKKIFQYSEYKTKK
ncbi:GNAT family N-acetyltransferase [Promethearchaeum syntrophicum]|uniref:GNAT family N-acetyltransferase n=1 Tax=Promethearchaeum syntrophicum TaxID=2594042 RepID=A0A5B9D628_9ARCH|nr:GNAT family N-acetyltransferase [Candidatus Prometheoarchaeum syntrophicum]QEE14247.1 ribosomal-protein-alanine N-acetyltransferase [Candidatus Prometheoarchaeum syntrophicum]